MFLRALDSRAHVFSGIWRREHERNDVTRNHNLHPVSLKERRFGFRRSRLVIALRRAISLARLSSLFSVAFRLFARRRSVAANVSRRVWVQTWRFFRHPYVSHRSKRVTGAKRPLQLGFGIAITARGGVFDAVRVASVIRVKRQRVHQPSRDHTSRRQRRHDVRPFSRTHNVARNAHSVR